MGPSDERIEGLAVHRAFGARSAWYPGADTAQRPDGLRIAHPSILSASHVPRPPNGQALVGKSARRRALRYDSSARAFPA